VTTCACHLASFTHFTGLFFDNPGLACQDAGAPDEEDPAAADLAFLEELAEQ